MSERTIHIATRGSQLALWQAHHVRDALLAARPAWAVELVVIKTTGDKILDRPLAQIGGKALFVKEIEQALLDGRADVAVHSMKDVPAELAPGLFMAAISAREIPFDALCSADGRGLDALPQGARVGTSSLRRQCQLLARRPDLAISMLRGNVPTRLGKLDSGDFDAVILAAAGLERLGHGDRISELLDPDVCLPAVGQGVLGIETRVLPADGGAAAAAADRAADAAADQAAAAAADQAADAAADRAADAAADRALVEALRQALHDPAEAQRVSAERAFLARLGGSCQTPLAAHAVYQGPADPAGTLEVRGLCGRPDGTSLLRAARQGPAADAAELGRTLAEDLLALGAQAIIDECTP